MGRQVGLLTILAEASCKREDVFMRTSDSQTVIYGLLKGFLYFM